MISEVALVALIGATVSIMDAHPSVPKLRLLRRFLSGFFLACFAGKDVAALVQHIFSFKVSEGGTIFFVAFIGSAVLERIILVINAFNLKSNWTKRK